MKLQVIDVNYTETKTGPVIHVYGKTIDGHATTIHVTDFRPYFYAGVKNEKIDVVEKIMKARGMEVERVERFEPIGYQTKKKIMLKIITQNPKDVRALREKVADIQNVKAIYESDILFRNRFCIDLGITGMGWVTIPDGKKEIDYRKIKVIKQ